MLNTLIVGASGYAGAELVSYVNRHPHMTITALTVSAQSNDAGKLISDLHPQLKGIVDLPLQPAQLLIGRPGAPRIGQLRLLALVVGITRG